MISINLKLASYAVSKYEGICVQVPLASMIMKIRWWICKW